MRLWITFLGEDLVIFEGVASVSGRGKPLHPTSNCCFVATVRAFERFGCQIGVGVPASVG